jgi:hypothetical protein
MGQYDEEKGAEVSQEELDGDRLHPNCDHNHGIDVDDKDFWLKEG